MPNSTAARMLEAQRDYLDAEGEVEKAQALANFVEAEAAHADRMGVERSPRGFIARVVLPSALLLILVVSFALNLALSVSTHQTANETQTTTEAVQALQVESIIAARQSCERTNDARASSVRNLRSDVGTLRAQLNLWTVVLATTPQAALEKADPKVLKAYTDNISHLRRGIANKKEAVEGAINSQKGVAIKPGSPRADCAKVVPLRSGPTP
jgi:hypothetical protein